MYNFRHTCVMKSEADSTERDGKESIQRQVRDQVTRVTSEGSEGHTWKLGEEHTCGDPEG